MSAKSFSAALCALLISVARAAGELPAGSVVHVQPLTLAMWNQGRHYNRMCPTADSAAGCPDDRMWAGCTAVATAIVLKYYEWPTQGETWYQTLNEEKSWTSDDNAIALRARFDEPYDWAGMQDVYGQVTSARASLAVAQLLSDIGAVMNMNYGTNGSSTLRDNVPGVLEHNFHFDASELHQLLRVEDFTPDAELRIQSQLRDGHPIVSAGAAGASGTGHTYVCDGFATTSPDGVVTNLYHFNFGWGGGSNGWYPLSAVFTQSAASDTPYSRPVESMLLGVFPQKAPLVLPADAVSGPDASISWSVAKCWTNRLQGFALERQTPQPVAVDEDLSDCWSVRVDGWGWSLAADGRPVARALKGDSYSGCWPTRGVNANTTKGVAVSAQSTLTITYVARQFQNGVTLDLIKSDASGSEWDEQNNYAPFPTVANLPGGTSATAFTTQTVEVAGADLAAVFRKRSGHIRAQVLRSEQRQAL